MSKNGFTLKVNFTNGPETEEDFVVVAVEFWYTYPCVVLVQWIVKKFYSKIHKRKDVPRYGFACVVSSTMPYRILFFLKKSKTVQKY